MGQVLLHYRFWFRTTWKIEMSKLQTPWGKAQSIEQQADGIRFITTASHGGFKLDRQRNAQVPACLRRAGGWYEEDVEYAIVYLIFGLGASSGELEYYKQVIKDHWPEAWEQYSGEKLELKDSRVLREKDFLLQNQNNYIACSAMGDWHPKVPKGMVGIIARKGGVPGGEEKCVLVTEEVYRGNYVVQPDDQAWNYT